MVNLQVLNTVVTALVTFTLTFLAGRQDRDKAIVQALRGLLWRPICTKYDFEKLAAHFPRVRKNHLRELLLRASAVTETSVRSGKEYWYLPARLKRK